MWGSIGWATPASFGAAMADREKRLVLLTGEGSHQLTIQEMANFFKYDIKPIILVLNMTLSTTLQTGIIKKRLSFFQGA